MDATRELPQIRQGTGQAVGDVGMLLPQLRRHRGLDRAQVQHQRHQPLLDAVVQVAFDLAPGLVTGRNDRVREAASSMRLCCSDPAMVLKLCCRTPISAIPRSGIRTVRSPCASRPAMAAASRTGLTIARVR